MATLLLSAQASTTCACALLAVPRQVTYADLGGIEGVLSDIRELIEHPLQHPEVSIIKDTDNPSIACTWQHP